MTEDYVSSYLMGIVTGLTAGLILGLTWRDPHVYVRMHSTIQVGAQLVLAISDSSP